LKKFSPENKEADRFKKALARQNKMAEIIATHPPKQPAKPTINEPGK
jgi:hypothetical protein